MTRTGGFPVWSGSKKPWIFWAILKKLTAISLIGGTNGKGSTCVYLEKLLIKAGLRTGVTMSPHISSYTERFRISGRDSTEQEIRDTEQEIVPLLYEIGLTYFEMTVVLAARLFSKIKG